MNVSYSSVLTKREPSSKRSVWLQKIIDTKTDEELFSYILSDNVSKHIAGIMAPSCYQNKRAKLTFEDLKEIALDTYPFITITEYRLEKNGKEKEYIKVEESKN